MKFLIEPFLRKPKTLVQALKRVSSRRRVERLLGNTAEEFLLDELSGMLGTPKENLLEKAANTLAIPPLFHLVTPERKLLEATGYQASQLRKLCVIPQPSEISLSGYCLVSACPERIDIEAFEAAGIRVFLGCGKEINKQWQMFEEGAFENSSGLSAAQLRVVLKRLAKDSLALGAEEVFIGHPADDRYELFANDKSYSGKLHVSVYEALIELLSESGRKALEIDDDVIEQLHISVTRSFHKTILCLTWKVLENRKSEERAKEAEAPVENRIEEKQIAVQAVEEAAEEPEEHKETTETKRILLIDDDGRFLLILQRILEGKGFIVETASDGKAALQHLKTCSEKPNLIVCDVHMPNMDGPRFVRTMAEEQLQYPVLILTSDDDPEQEAELALQGVDALVRKQEDPKILLAWISNLLQKKPAIKHLTYLDTQGAPLQ